MFLPRNLKSHEDLHKRGERNVVCPKCGVKFFEKSSLHSHMMVHDKDRVKRFKCEFCDKAYFNSGALSLHKRKHLGKMVYCPLCSKEFYRQHELNKHHISAHSAALPNANLNKVIIQLNFNSLTLQRQHIKFELFRANILSSAKIVAKMLPHTDGNIINYYIQTITK